MKRLRADAQPGLFSLKKLDEQKSWLKGGLAELIIERMFAAHGHSILRNGIETRFPGVDHNQECNRSPAYIHLRRAPDFVLTANDGRNRKTVSYLEIKYSWNGRIDPHGVSVYREYPETILIVVSPGKIRGCLIDNYDHIDALVPLVEIPQLCVNPEAVEYFERITERAFDWA
jgi:hypothetical protein